MKVIVGTNNGMLKIINLDENIETARFGKYGLNNTVETLCWADPDSEELVGAGYSEGDVQFWNPTSRKLVHDCGKRGGKVKGLFTFEKESGRVVVTCTDNRQLEICPIELPEDYSHSFKKLEGNNESAIWKMRANPLSPQHILYAGKQIMPTLYDIERGKTVWRGVFGNPKFYGLKQRQFFTDFQFMPDSASVFATGSRYREFRIFDLRKGNAPVIDFDVSKTAEWEYAMISLAVTYHTPTVVYATEATGKIATFDLRTGRLHKVYRDGIGTVKNLAFHPTERTMGAVGLDRYLRVYDIDKRLQKINDKSSLQYRVRLPGMVGANMYNKMFLKQKLNSILFFSEERIKKVMEDRLEEQREQQRQREDVKKEEASDSDEEVVEEEEEKKPIVLEDEDVWGNLEQVVHKNEDDDDLIVIKDEPDSGDEDETPKRSSKAKSAKLKKEKPEDLDDDDEVDGADDDEDAWADLEDDDSDAEGDIKLGEFDDDDDEVEEGEDGEVEDGDEDEDADSSDDGGDEDEDGKPKSNGTKEGNGKVKGEKKTDNKRKRRQAKEKEEKQQKLKKKKAAIVNAKKGRQLAKKRKLLSK